MKLNIYSLADVEPGDEVTVKYLGGTWTGVAAGSAHHSGLTVMEGRHSLRFANGDPDEVVEFLVATRELPDWPYAEHVWWEGEVFARGADGSYTSATRTRPRDSSVTSMFAREAVPVGIHPLKEWDAWASTRGGYPDEALFNASERLVGRVGLD